MGGWIGSGKGGYLGYGSFWGRADLERLGRLEHQLDIVYLDIRREKHGSWELKEWTTRRNTKTNHAYFRISHGAGTAPMTSKGIVLFLLPLHILLFFSSHLFPSPSSSSSSSSSPILEPLTSTRYQGKTVGTIILLHWLNKITNVLAMEGGTREHRLLQVANKEHKVPRREIIQLVQGHSGTRIQVSWLPIKCSFCSTIEFSRPTKNYIPHIMLFDSWNQPFNRLFCANFMLKVGN